MPNNKPRIAVDAMGGDFGPRMVVPGALHAAKAGQAEVILVGDQDAIAAELVRKLPTPETAAKPTPARDCGDSGDEAVTRLP